MRPLRHVLLHGLCLALLALPPIGRAVTPNTATPAQPVTWDRQRGLLKAQVSEMPLHRLLRALAAETGWQIWVQPEVDVSISTRFDALPPGDALPRLFGGLNFSLAPQPDGKARLHVFRSNRNDATEAIRPLAPESTPGSEGRILNELIVRLKPGTSGSITNLAARLGARIAGRIDALDAYRLTFDDEQAAQAAREQAQSDPDVASVEDNFTIGSPDRLDALRNATPAPLALKPKVVPSDQQVVVALIDTAVGNANPLLKEFLLDPVSVAGTDTGGAENLMHGAAMAETILRSLASQPQEAGGTSVRILPVDVYGGRSATTTFDIVQGLYAAAPLGPDIVNLSLGSAGDSPLLQETIRSLRSQGVLVIAAAGNDGTTAPTYPAASPDALAVTAVDRGGQLASYANRGAFVDLAAPGSAIVHLNNQILLGSGTSYAAAHVSGAAANQFTTTGATADSVEASLRQRYTLPPTTPPAR